MTQTVSAPRLRVADALEAVTEGDLPFRFTAFDGSATGPRDAGYTLHVANERGLRFILTAPSDLGLARAYLSQDLQVQGTGDYRPGDPYQLLRDLQHLRLRRPAPGEIARLVKGLGLSRLVPPEPPAQEAPPRWRRSFDQLRERTGFTRAAKAISHHYDVGNPFYERVLGPSMTYTCALYRTADSTLEQAQHDKYELVADKLQLQPGQRLLDVGCGWGGMVRHAAREYGVRALGVTLSRQQALWATEAIEREGLSHLAEVRHLDYRHVEESGFDAISSIGLTEHIGLGHYTEYFRFLNGKLKPGGRLLNHCITNADLTRRHRPGGFIDRYVFPDGELATVGLLLRELNENAGFEVQHVENLRQHYAMTLRDWCRNLDENWEECVALSDEATAKVWGLYMAGSRVSFESLHGIELIQVLATRHTGTEPAPFPLRPDWRA